MFCCFYCAHALSAITVDENGALVRCDVAGCGCREHVSAVERRRRPNETTLEEYA